MNWINPLRKGARTIAAAVVVGVGPFALNWATSQDWTATLGLSPTTGAIIAAVMLGLRAITSTSIGKAS